MLLLFVVEAIWGEGSGRSLASATATTASGAGTQSYIVVLKPGKDPDSVAHDATGYGAEVPHLYKSALKGFAAKMSDAAVSALSARDDVAYIEPDGSVSTFSQTVPVGITRIGATDHPYFGAALDVDIAIIDTGIEASHPDLNYFNGADFTGEGLFDGHGHGTHVAGIAAAKDNDIGVVGVAPGSRLWAVKVLNSSGSGSFSTIIAGLDYVAQHSSEIEVANMSLGGSGYSQALRDAIANCVNRGVTIVVAAGNSSADVHGSDEIFGSSDDTVPAAYPECMTVSAMADTDGLPGAQGSPTSYAGDDQLASFSNHSINAVAGDPVTSWGAAINLSAPGVNILSTYKGGSYASMSGTSMAAPHVAGSVALYIAQHGRASDAAGVYAMRQALIDAGQPQYVWQGGNTADPEYNHEFMVFNATAWWSPPGPPPPPPPVTIPVAPTNLVAHRNNTRSVGIVWVDNSTNERYFEIQKSTKNTNGTWAQFVTIGTGPANFNGYIDGNAKRTSAYRYRVRAGNVAGTSPWSNIVEVAKN